MSIFFAKLSDYTFIIVLTTLPATVWTPWSPSGTRVNTQNTTCYINNFPKFYISYERSWPVLILIFPVIMAWGRGQTTDPASSCPQSQAKRPHVHMITLSQSAARLKCTAPLGGKWSLRPRLSPRLTSSNKVSFTYISKFFLLHTVKESYWKGYWGSPGTTMARGWCQNLIMILQNTIVLAG